MAKEPRCLCKALTTHRIHSQLGGRPLLGLTSAVKLSETEWGGWERKKGRVRERERASKRETETQGEKEKKKARGSERQEGEETEIEILRLSRNLTLLDQRHLALMRLAAAGKQHT